MFRSGPKGRDVTARVEPRGSRPEGTQPCKGDTTGRVRSDALAGLDRFGGVCPQGFTLGYHMARFQRGGDGVRGLYYTFSRSLKGGGEHAVRVVTSLTRNCGTCSWCSSK